MNVKKNTKYIVKLKILKNFMKNILFDYQIKSLH